MNHIKIYDNVLSKQKCNDIIEFFESNSNKIKGEIGVEYNTIGVQKNKKDSTDLLLNFSSPRDQKETLINQYIKFVTLQNIRKYKKTFPFLDEIFQWDIENGYNIQKFDEGQGYYAMHCENPGDNQRMLVWMIYLNNAKCGTRFYYPTRDIRAKQGRLVIWPAGWTHPHSGITPNKGDKYIITGWYSHN